MIAVNVRRSFRDDESTSRQVDAVQGDWAGLSARTCDSHIGECLLGVQRNHVVWLGVIERWAPVEGERVRFTTRPLSSSEIEVARSAAISVGASAPSWALWRQGQGNPVRVGPHLGIGSDDAPTAGDRQTIHLGVFKIVHDPNCGELRVFAPAGAQVLITAQP